MNVLLWIVIGAVMGWIASLVMKMQAEHGILLNIVAGIVGACLAGVFVSPFLAADIVTHDTFSVQLLFVSLGGAILLLAVVRLFRRLPV
jgi:uncharacterized membrane protein YeaQ/YmgE (transglycosylase-associated protein family)